MTSLDPDISIGTTFVISLPNTFSTSLSVTLSLILGSLVSYTMMNPTVPAFIHCTACCSAIVESYQSDKLELVYQTCDSSDGSYLEDVAGLTAFRAAATEKLAEMEALDDEDDWGEEG